MTDSAMPDDLSFDFAASIEIDAGVPAVEDFAVPVDISAVPSAPDACGCGVSYVDAPGYEAVFVSVTEIA